MSTLNQAEDTDAIRTGLKELITQRLKLDIAPSSIQDDAPLFAGSDAAAPGGLSLDSVEALEIVVGIEERWGVVIQDDSVASEFYSVDTLANLVRRLLAEGAAGQASEASKEALGA